MKFDFSKFTNIFLLIALLFNVILPLAPSEAKTKQKAKATNTKKKTVKRKAPSPAKPPESQVKIQNKQKKIIELITSREDEIKGSLADLMVLYKEGLVTLQEEEPFKQELRELEQFEFIVRNPSGSSYESALKEKLSTKLTSMQADLKRKQELWNEGLIAAKEIEALEEKAALYNFILEFLSDESRLPRMLAFSGNFLSTDLLFGRYFPIASSFGFRIDPINPTRKQFHAGVDFAAWASTPIRAPIDGVVTKVVTSTSSGGGMQIRLRHADDLETAYMHLSKILVRKGQRVKAGEIIALVGATGTRVTGPHLHFEVHVKGVPVNPLKFFKK